MTFKTNAQLSPFWQTSPCHHLPIACFLVTNQARGRPFEMIQYLVSAFCIAQHYSNGKFHNVLIETLLVQQSSRLFSCPPEICIALFSITVFRHALILLPHRHQLSRLTSKSHPKTNKHLFVTDFRLTLQFCIIALNLPIFQNKMHSTKTFILDKYFLFMLWEISACCFYTHNLIDLSSDKRIDFLPESSNIFVIGNRIDCL